MPSNDQFNGKYDVQRNYIHPAARVRMFWLIRIRGWGGVWMQGEGRYWALYLNLPKKMYSVHFKLPKLGL